MKRLFFLYVISFSVGQKIMIPMDQAQNDHLKAYGIAYYSLTKSINVEWLLNYRGGAFLFDEPTKSRYINKSHGKLRLIHTVRLYWKIRHSSI